METFFSPHLTPHCELSFLLSLSVAVPERSSHYHTLASVDSWVGIFNPTHRNFPRENVVFIFIRALCIFMLSSRFRSSSARPTHFALLPAAALLFGIPFKCCEWNEESEEDNRGKVFIFLLTLPVLARILSIFLLSIFPHRARWEIVVLILLGKNFYGFFSSSLYFVLLCVWDKFCDVFLMKWKMTLRVLAHLKFLSSS